MATPSRYERQEIATLLGNAAAAPPPARDGLVVGAAGEAFDYVIMAAVLPALRDNGLNGAAMATVLDSDSSLERICREVLSAEVVIVDVSEPSPEVQYVLGLCHGLGRCPLLLWDQAADPPPFDLASLRHVAYEATPLAMMRLREELSRAIRVFLSAARASG